MKIKYKNYCICKRKKGIMYINQDCFARFHTGKVSTIEYDPEALYYENIERNKKNKFLC